MNWLNNWQRSPRQNRRTVIDGKFVELAPLEKDTEREESTLEIVTEDQNDLDTGTSTGESVSAGRSQGQDAGHDSTAENGNRGVQSGGPEVAQSISNAEVPAATEIDIDVDKAFRFLTPTEIEEKGITVLSGTGEGTLGEDVLDGQAGRTESEKLQEELEPLPEREDYPF